MGDAFARLSTGLKMLIILSAALLPLGLIAVVASMQSTQAARHTRESEAAAMLSAASRLLADRIDDDLAGLRRAAATMGGPDPSACRAALEPLVSAGRGRFALIGPDGTTICVAGDTGPSMSQALPQGAETVASLPAEGGRLRFAARIASGGLIGVGEYPPEVAQRAVRPVLVDRFLVRIRDGDRFLPLNRSPVGAQAGDVVRVSEAIGGGPAQLELVVADPPISPVELLTALLPILMWLAAAIIGWSVVDRLLLMPLGQIQRAIRNYRTGDGPLTLPLLTTPALEIRALGDEFQRVTERLTSHEAELEQGLARQIRLTREVHHRVKNNLQVVSSLINLHARGADDAAVVRAYASIQRRVDALAVVHRHHFAELEENRGVGLRPLIGELAANLRATAPPHASHFAITLDLIPAFASQDVAVPIAFLITEIVELAMECDPESRVAILLVALDEPGRALLTIVAPSLAGATNTDSIATTRYLRVTEGLSRQLRAKLRREEDGTRLAIEIAVAIPDEETA